MQPIEENRNDLVKRYDDLIEYYKKEIKNLENSHSARETHHQEIVWQYKEKIRRLDDRLEFNEEIFKKRLRDKEIRNLDYISNILIVAGTFTGFLFGYCLAHERSLGNDPSRTAE